jgi:hypothetical protein
LIRRHLSKWVIRVSDGRPHVCRARLIFIVKHSERSQISEYRWLRANSDFKKELNKIEAVDWVSMFSIVLYSLLEQHIHLKCRLLFAAKYRHWLVMILDETHTIYYELPQNLNYSLHNTGCGGVSVIKSHARFDHH